MSRRLAAAVAVVLLVLTGSAAPAAAAQITVRWTCVAITGGWSTGDYRVTLTAPATATAGQTVTVTAAVESTGTQSTHLAAGTVRATMIVELGGVSSGRITLPGLTNPDIQPGTPWRVAGGTGQVVLAARGQVTFHPVQLDGGAWKCGKTAPPYPVAATTQVS